MLSFNRKYFLLHYLIVLRHLHQAGVPLSADWPGLAQLQLTAVSPPLTDPASLLVQGHQPHLQQGHHNKSNIHIHLHTLS